MTAADTHREPGSDGPRGGGGPGGGEPRGGGPRGGGPRSGPGGGGPRGGVPVLPETGPDPGEPELHILADRDALADAAARLIVDLLVAAVNRRGRAEIALTGGSTAPAVYRRLIAADLRDQVPWDRVGLWWGDDRYVPRGHPLSNVTAADEILFAREGIRVAAEQIHPFPTGRAMDGGQGAARCATTYAAEMARTLQFVHGWPSFDLVLVGIGEDGHLLSVFPGSEALRSDCLALAIPAPVHIEPHVPRVTLNPAFLGAAGHVVALAAGATKAGVIARILDGPRDPARLPATLARRANATWLLDAAAATGLIDR